MVEFNLFNSDTFENLAKNFEIQLGGSSPHCLQADGSAEIALDIAKRILLVNGEYVNYGFLAYRNGPLASGLSPAELLYGRKLRTTIPSVRKYKQVSKNEIKKL